MTLSTSYLGDSGSIVYSGHAGFLVSTVWCRVWDDTGGYQGDVFLHSKSKIFWGGWVAGLEV